MKEDYLEDQLIFGRPDSSTPVTYSQTCYFDSHLSDLSPTVFLPASSLNTSRGSLSNSFSIEYDKNSRLTNATSQPIRKSKTANEDNIILGKIKDQSVRQLHTWKRVSCV